MLMCSKCFICDLIASYYLLAFFKDLVLCNLRGFLLYVVLEMFSYFLSLATLSLALIIS